MIWGAGSILRSLGQAGWRRRAGVPFDALLLAEFIDLTRLNGAPADIDYLVDGERIRPRDLLLFVTEKQARLLRGLGCTRAEIAGRVAAKGYGLIWCGEWPLLRRDLKALLATGVRSLRCFSAPLPAADAFAEAWRGCRQLAPLFRRARARACLYPKFPNGHADWRRDSAVVTGLCRQQGITSAGCQTRVVYGPVYEFAFDCYDLYLVWGPAWYRPLARAFRPAGRPATVGCPALDALLPAAARIQPSREGAGRQILIFTGDIGGGHCTVEYNIAFLESCLALAAAYPSDRFRVKVKDPEHADKFATNPRLRSAMGRCVNFEFLKRQRHDYAELLASADVVLAFGFTTPGTEALLLGIPAIYFSRLGEGGRIFPGNPRWLARTAAELKVRFGECGSPESREGLDELDPYRDGQARGRMTQALLAC